MKKVDRFGTYVVLTDIVEDEKMADIIKNCMVELSKSKEKSLAEMGMKEVPKSTRFTVRRWGDLIDPFDDQEMQVAGPITVSIRYLAYRDEPAEDTEKPQQEEVAEAYPAEDEAETERQRNEEGV